MNARPTYSQLGELLESLGFSPCSKPDEFLGYEQSETGTIFRFAPHAEQEPVIPHDLVRVRRMLDLVNLLSSDDFDSWRSQASAVDTKAVS